MMYALHTHTAGHYHLTQDPFDFDRFHTGDLGRMDATDWVRVTGRLKEQYKLENGKYVVSFAHFLPHFVFVYKKMDVPDPYFY
jgi:hypothetical protein